MLVSVYEVDIQFGLILCHRQTACGIGGHDVPRLYCILSQASDSIVSWTFYSRHDHVVPSRSESPFDGFQPTRHVMPLLRFEHLPAR